MSKSELEKFYPYSNLQNAFLEDLEYGRVCISSSIKGSGKTTFMIAVLMELLKRGNIKRYALVFPNFLIERRKYMMELN